METVLEGISFSIDRGLLGTALWLPQDGREAGSVE